MKTVINVKFCNCNIFHSSSVSPTQTSLVIKMTWLYYLFVYYFIIAAPKIVLHFNNVLTKTLHFNCNAGYIYHLQCYVLLTLRMRTGFYARSYKHVPAFKFIPWPQTINGENKKRSSKYAAVGWQWNAFGMRTDPFSNIEYFSATLLECYYRRRIMKCIYEWYFV